MSNASSLLQRVPTWGRWCAMLGVSLAVASIFSRLSIPASTLLAAMGTGVFFASSGWTLRVPRMPFTLAQGLVGTLIASSITAPALSAVLDNWVLVVAMVLSVSVISGFLGWLLSRTGVLPGSTAVWGTSPGAALLMTIMSEQHGGDPRLVAFMQYLRVIMVAVSASLVSRFVGANILSVRDAGGAEGIDWVVYVPGVLLALAGMVAGRVVRFSSAPIMLPLLVGGLLSGLGVVNFVLPWWLLYASYIVIGWTIGLRFTKAIVRHALRAFPRVFLTIASLIVICGIFGAFFGPLAGIDPLTAYLATSPGGMDAIAIIAASTDANLSFIMAVQTSRFILVTLTGPALATFITKKTGMNLPANDG